MPNSEFYNPILLSTGDLVVSGPFKPAVAEGLQVFGEVTIRFLIIQHLQGQQPVVVDEVASWTSGDSWEKTVPASRVAGLQVGEVRAIGIAIVVWQFDPPTPPAPREDPAIETFTWCVKREVVHQAV
jgi:hypothetical protein